MTFQKGDLVVIDRELTITAYGRAVSKAWADIEMEVIATTHSRDYVELGGSCKHGVWDKNNPLTFRAAALRLIDEPVVEEDWS